MSYKIVNYKLRLEVKDIILAKKQQFESYKQYLRTYNQFLQNNYDKYKDLVTLQIYSKGLKRRVISKINDDKDI